ncbi:polysaccharide deacetylase family protein [Streptosporangium sp. NPDC000396]|uniref:polysaccharide deacetylase family protein n=1 Tax=Streptosporangium sp. NPDC000396 TaxID=3366185 RepID=UPI003679284E
MTDEDGREATSPVRFRAGQRADVVAYLHQVAGQSGQRLVTVVESTNGVLDGAMMVSGLEVYRADPWALPERPLLGSAPALVLAEAARRDLSALAKLKIDGGTLTGRIDELDAGIARSAAAEEPLKRRGRWIRHGRRTDAKVALTFDDGPHPPFTGQILDVLERYAVPAAFFCVGLHATAGSQEVARMSEAGHVIGNHTWSHPFLPDLSRDQLDEQIERTHEVLALAGGTPSNLFRPPYGSRTPEVVGWLGARDLRTVLWDVEPSDWAMPGADVIAQRVLEQAQPGSVVLMHDGGGDRSQTVEALPAVIEGLLDRGHRIVPLTELLESEGE